MVCFVGHRIHRSASGRRLACRGNLQGDVDQHIALFSYPVYLALFVTENGTSLSLSWGMRFRSNNNVFRSVPWQDFQSNCLRHRSQLSNAKTSIGLG